MKRVGYCAETQELEFHGTVRDFDLLKAGLSKSAKLNGKTLNISSQKSYTAEGRTTEGLSKPSEPRGQPQNSPMTNLNSETGGTIMSSQLIMRTVFFIFLVWTGGTIVYIFLFEPYGSRLSDREWSHAIKIALAPPIFLSMVAFAYSRLFRR